MCEKQQKVKKKKPYYFKILVDYQNCLPFCVPSYVVLSAEINSKSEMGNRVYYSVSQSFFNNQRYADV